MFIYVYIYIYMYVCMYVCSFPGAELIEMVRSDKGTVGNYSVYHSVFLLY